MKNKYPIALFVAGLLLSGHNSFAAETNDPSVELTNLIVKIKADVQAIQATQAALGNDIKQFDVLLEEHKGEKTDAVARILYMKAVFYSQLFHDNATADAVIEQLKSNFQGTKVVAAIEAQEKKMAEGKKIQASLIEGVQFPDFDEKDLAGKPLSSANYKGKVVLIDFWATWCPLCVAEMPNAIQTYQKYHAQGFEVIGINLDTDRQKLDNFIKVNGIPWPQFYDGQYFDTKLAVKCGVDRLPTTYLLDREGKIIARNLRGEEFQSAVAKALAAK